MTETEALAIAKIVYNSICKIIAEIQHDFPSIEIWCPRNIAIDDYFFSERRLLEEQNK